MTGKLFINRMAALTLCRAMLSARRDLVWARSARLTATCPGKLVAPVKWSVFLIAAGAALCAIPAEEAAAQAAAEYTLNSDDVLQVRVGHWDATAGVYRPWDGFSGQYRIGPDGRVSLPIAGAVEAAGDTTSELSDRLAVVLQAQIGLTIAPAVAVEVVTYGPIFVSGDVTAPGQYAYQPGMVVEQAVALASGSLRGTAGDAGLNRQLISLQGERERAVERRAAALIELSRIEAELAGEDTMKATAEAPAMRDPETAFSVNAELLVANRQAVAERLQSVEELVALLKEQVVKLDEQMALLGDEIVRAEKAFEAQQSLAARGLAVTRTEDAVASRLASLRTREIALTVERLRATQDLNAAERDRDTVRNERRILLLTQLDTVNEVITDLTIAIETQTSLMSELVRAGGQLTGMAEMVEITIMRRRNAAGAREVIAADLQTELAPGDTVLLRRELIDGVGAPRQ